MMMHLRPRWELIWELAKTDWKLRYSGSWLGIAWNILKPLLMFGILYMVFSSMFVSAVPQYGLSLLIGVVLWNYFAEGTIAGIQSLLGKGHLLAKVALSPLAIVLASTLHGAMTFLFNLLVIAVFLGIRNVVPTLAGLAFFLVACTLLAALILSVSLLLAPLLVRYRDLRQLWDVVLTLGFYATPILYPLAVVPEPLRQVLSYSPMALIIQGARAALLDPTALPWFSLLRAASMLSILLVIATLLFQRTVRGVSELL